MGLKFVNSPSGVLPPRCTSCGGPHIAGRAVCVPKSAGRTFTDADLAAHRARMERCRLSGCTPDEHRCLDDGGEWGSFDGPDAA